MVSLILFVRSSSLLFLYHLQVSVASSSFVLLFSIASFSVVVLRRAIAHHRHARVVLDSQQLTPPLLLHRRVQAVQQLTKPYYTHSVSPTWMADPTHFNGVVIKFDFQDRVVSCLLLSVPAQVSAVIGKGGKVAEKIRAENGCKIRA